MLYKLNDFGIKKSEFKNYSFKNENETKFLNDSSIKLKKSNELNISKDEVNVDHNYVKIEKKIKNSNILDNKITCSIKEEDKSKSSTRLKLMHKRDLSLNFNNNNKPSINNKNDFIKKEPINFMFNHRNEKISKIEEEAKLDKCHSIKNNYLYSYKKYEDKNENESNIDKAKKVINDKNLSKLIDYFKR